MRPIVARDVMTPEVLAVDEAISLQELASFLIDNEVSGVVVRGEDGTPIGVVSSTDIAAAAAQGDGAPRRRKGFYDEGWSHDFDDAELAEVELADDELTAGDIMTPEIFSVTADTPVAEVARLLCDSRVHRLLVTENDELVGIITTSDLLGLLIDTPN
jgi:CBS domain-containing protein